MDRGDDSSYLRPCTGCISAAALLVLGLAIRESERLDGFLYWADQPLVKSAEALLIFFFTVHMFGGLRLLIIENFDWRDIQKQLATLAVGVSAIIAFVFLVRVF